MKYDEFKALFAELGNSYKTKDIDRLNKRLIKEKTDVSFLKPHVLENQEYYRTYFQVSLGLCENIDEKIRFIDENLELLQDWWHTDEIPVFLRDELSFELAYKKSQEWIKSDLPFARRLGYIIFIPRLVKDPKRVEQLLSLCKNDDEYYVYMGEAWLISFCAMCDADKTYKFLQDCDLKYNIVGKAIQKICDSYVISAEDKDRFKELRAKRKISP